MKAKNNLYYFESYDEIRSYMAQGFPARVYLTTRRACVVKGEQVVCPDDDKAGRYMENWEREQGVVVEPEDNFFPKTVAQLEDYAPEEYATRYNFRRETIEADTLLNGLYKAGDMLAMRLKTTADERRTSFTANELMAPEKKGGAKVTWPVEEQVVLYEIKTDTGRYQTAQFNVFELIAKVEKIDGVGTAKRRRFATDCEVVVRNVVVRMTFTADKAIAKMRSLWETDNLRPVLCQPAIEVATGIMVCSNGHLLAAHKLQDFKAEVLADGYGNEVLSLPREITQMKGAITVEVEAGDNDKITIVASDEKGKQGTIVHPGRFPNWRSVIPRKIGRPIEVDAPLWSKTVKQMMPHISKSSELIWLDALRDGKEIKFCGEDYDFSKEITISVPTPKGAGFGLWIGLKASGFLSILAFEPTKMHYTDPSRAMVFIDNTTVTLIMPMLLDNKPAESRGPREDYDMVDFDLDKWIAMKAIAKPAVKTTGTVAAKKKPAVKTTGTVAPKPTIEQLKAALLARLAA